MTAATPIKPPDNNVIEEAIKENLEDQETMFSVTGADDNTDGGFVQLSGYLLTHPFLSANEKLVLAYLAYRAKSFTDLRACKPTKSKATRTDVRHDLSMKRQTADRVLRQLESLGLIVKVGGVGRAPVEFVLQPGPWPKLGDRPVRGRTWRDAMIYKLDQLKKRWLSAFKDTEVTLEAARQVLQGKEAEVGLKTPSKPKEETDKILKTPKRSGSRFDHTSSEDENRSGSRFVHTSPRSGSQFVHSESEGGFSTPNPDASSGTQKSENRLARTRGLIDISSVGKQRSSIRESASADRSGDPQTSRVNPPTAGADLQPGDVRGFPACISDVNNSPRQRLEQAEAEARKLKRKPKNPNLQVEQRYRELVEERFDISIAKFGAGQKKQVKYVVNRYGAKTMLKAVDWLFDNWKTLKRNNPKFYGGDKYPPLRSLTSFNLMDRYLPYVEKGEPMQSNDGEHWRKWTSDMEDGRQHEAEIDVIEQHLGGGQ